MTEWIDVNDNPIDFSKVAFILTEDDEVKPFRNVVGIFEHHQALWDIANAKAWMPKPNPPKE